MRSLVTGGAGFIGSHLADALVGADDEVMILDDLSAGSRGNLEAAATRAQLVVADVRDAEALGREVARFLPDRVFHLAAQADVRRSVADPGSDAAINVVGTINVLETVRLAGGLPVIFASTGGAVYGEGKGRGLPFAESVPAAPETPYGASKLAGETYLALYRRLHAVPSLALRLANVYGPRQDPHGEAGVVAIIAGKLLAGEPPVIYGDGRQTRDYVHVDDVVRAMIAAAAALHTVGTTIGGPINVGTGLESSVLDLLRVLLAAAGSDAEAVFAPARTGEIERISIDPARASAELGWSPAITLDRGLRATLESVRTRLAG